jgi:hypothetical protein
MNSQQLATAIRQWMDKPDVRQWIADIEARGTGWKWSVGVFNDVRSRQEKLTSKECLSVWPVGNAEIARTALEQLTRLDTAEVDYHFIENNPGPYFIGLWVEQVPAQAIV